jgi:hypothetical protein
VLAPKAPPIQLSPEEERALSRLVMVHSTPQKLAKPARIILLGAAGKGIGESAAALGVWLKTVRHWRRRWEAAPSTAHVAERLSDAPPQRRAGDIHGGANPPDHGAGLRGSRAAAPASLTKSRSAGRVRPSCALASFRNSRSASKDIAGRGKYLL